MTPADDSMEQRILKHDGYLDMGDDSCNDTVLPGGAPLFEIRNIVYHPQLNVLLAFGVNNLVKVLDVKSGVTLQTYQLSTNGKQQPTTCVHTFMYRTQKICYTDAQIRIQIHTQMSIYCNVFCKFRLYSLDFYKHAYIHFYIHISVCMYFCLFVEV